jgi:hypothetical protein
MDDDVLDEALVGRTLWEKAYSSFAAARGLRASVVGRHQ